jgi:phenylpropionate dioxygenase-like ring-hydroxylating dioxygenase large terminal subunit
MTTLHLDIDGDIARARTPPSALYTDEGWYRTVLERVFPSSWQCITTPSPAPGEVAPLEVGGEPLLLTTDPGGTTRCLSNVCTHRGFLVCEQAGKRGGLRCRYHGRRFGLDGGFQHSPEFEGAEDFPAERDDLPHLPLESWGPLSFTSMTPGIDFEAWSAPIHEHLAPRLPVDELRHDPAGDREFKVAANWILYCENYLEGLHIPFVHPGLNELLEYGSYRTELLPWGSLQVGMAKPGEPAFADGVGGLYLWLFPNLMLNLYPWGLSLNRVDPAGVGACRVRYRRFVARPELVGKGAGGDLDTVEQEDDEVVEGVQVGVGSRLYDRGRYSPSQERGTHHLHRLLQKVLEGA